MRKRKKSSHFCIKALKLLIKLITKIILIVIRICFKGLSMAIFSLLAKKKLPKQHSYKQGVRKDIGKMYFRSGWEANFARYLNFLIKQKQIYKWEYEPDTFWFNDIKRGIRSYLPDFKVWDKRDSQPYYIEVKGHMDSRSRTKLKRMAKYYPKVRVDLVRAKQYNEIKKKLSPIIPGWE